MIVYCFIVALWAAFVHLKQISCLLVVYFFVFFVFNTSREIAFQKKKNKNNPNCFVLFHFSHFHLKFDVSNDPILIFPNKSIPKHKADFIATVVRAYFHFYFYFSQWKQHSENPTFRKKLKKESCKKCTKTQQFDGIGIL